MCVCMCECICSMYSPMHLNDLMISMSEQIHAGTMHLALSPMYLNDLMISMSEQIHAGQHERSMNALSPMEGLWRRFHIHNKHT